MIKLVLVIATFLSLTHASPVRKTRGGCTSSDPKCWMDDGYGGWVFVDNPNYGGNDQEDECSPGDEYCDLTGKNNTVAPADPRTVDIGGNEVSSQQVDKPGRG